MLPWILLAGVVLILIMLVVSLVMKIIKLVIFLALLAGAVIAAYYFGLIQI